MTKQELIDFELRVKAAWEAGLIKAPLHLCGGNEDQLIEIFKEIKPDDYVYSSHRNHYHALLHGCDPEHLYKEILGQLDTACMGRARSMGYIDVSSRFYSSAIVGGCCAIAVGVAWALRQKQEDFKADPLNTDEFAVRPEQRRVWCFVGDGCVDGGHFWEALQYADGFELPITFVVEDNERATCTTTEDRCGKGRTQREFYVSERLRSYYYEPTYPHVGSGKYVAF